MRRDVIVTKILYKLKNDFGVKAFRIFEDDKLLKEIIIDARMNPQCNVCPIETMRHPLLVQGKPPGSLVLIAGSIVDLLAACH